MGLLNDIKKGISRKYFHRIFIYYIALLAIPAMLLSMFYYNQLTMELEKEMEDKNQQLIDQTANTFNIVINQLLSLTRSISSDKNVIELLNFPEKEFYENNQEFSDNEKEELYNYLLLKKKVTDTILMGKYNNEFIDSIYLYDFYDKSLYGDSSTLMLTNEVTQDISELGKDQSRIKALDSRLINMQDSQMKSYNIQILSKTYDNRGILSVSVNLDKLYSKVLEPLLGKDNTRYILEDINGNELFASKIRNVVHDKDRFDFRQIIAAWKKNGQQNDFAVNTALLNTNNWVLIGITDLRPMKNNTHIRAVLFLFVTLCCISFFILIAYGASKKLYKPIWEIKNQVDNYMLYDKKQKKTNGNEFESIKNGIKAIFSEKNTLAENVKQLSPMVKESFLRNLLYNEFSLTDYEKALFSLDEIRLVEGDEWYFQIIVLQTSSVLSKDNMSKILEKCLDDLSEFGISALFEEKSIIMIVNSTIKNGKGIIYSKLTKIMDFIIGEFGQQCMIGLGKKYPFVKDIKKSFREAQECINYKLLYGFNSIVSAENILINIENTDRQITDMITGIETLVSLGEYSKVVSAFSCLLDSLADGDKTITLFIIKKLLLDMLRRIMKDIEDSSKENYTFEDYNDIYYEFVNLQYRDELLQWFHSFFAKVCNYWIQNKSRNTLYVDMIKRYIEENITRDISLQEVADHIQLNASYASRLFSECNHTSLTDYINVSKIDKAKDLLAEGKMRIKDLSVYFGYSSVNYFIKTFKKYTGMTPNSFKNQYGVTVNDQLEGG